MMTSLSPSAQRVQDALSARGVELQVVEMPDSTRTSADAAAAVGCSVGQIAKSLIFKGKSSHRPLLVIASGSNRVDEKKIAAIFGEKIEKPDADFVRARTGFVIGGVPPLGHTEPLTTLIDADLFQYSEIWGAAGTPNAVFRLTPQQLAEITGGDVVDVKRDA
jgi:prolyl-tRNA editing enzyme YbaK/EbsC (Cys-tRNA(Pro) deacylase)